MKALFIGTASVCSVFLIALYLVGVVGVFATEYNRADAKGSISSSATNHQNQIAQATTDSSVAAAVTSFDTAAYDKKLLLNANNPAPKVSSSSAASSSTTIATTTHHLWPVKTVYPKAGALLPFNRIVAYYGNFYSTKMGVLGKYPPPQMLQRLRGEVTKWQAADPSTPVIPAIDYIVITAQGSPGADKKYRLRMPADQIQQALSLADQVHGIVILDVQVGLSNLQTELPLLAPYLKLPNVELAIDPEFSMKDGAKPGTEIGTFSSSDVNYAANYLATLVKENNLPPKILVIHRFTKAMVTGYKQIQPLPEVQMVMDMDGWGSPAKKLNTYKQFVYSEPIQFTGFKLFYVNDLKPPSTRMLTYAELLKLTPQPLFIQYQ